MKFGYMAAADIKTHLHVYLWFYVFPVASGESLDDVVAGVTEYF